ncbi:MAG: hypothetical protein IID16_12505 [Candidatus Marinimicrobia bacterium]|nr:hypothetical protein [Candidatus Neomarinimicrobiota bacterium]
MKVMQGSIIDTLSISKRLRSVGIAEDQAEVHAQIFAEVIENNLATKQDIALIHKDMEQLQSELHRDLAEMKASLLKWVFGMFLTQTAILVTMIALIT